MKLRIAKKIIRDQHIRLLGDNTSHFLWSDLAVARACRRLQRHKNNSDSGKVTKQSLRFVRFIISNRNNRKDIQSEWEKLRTQILQNWYPERWNQDLYQNEFLRWEAVETDKLLKKAIDPEYISNDYLYDPITRLESDTFYYSDRWCEMRVAFIDRIVEWMMSSDLTIHGN